MTINKTSDERLAELEMANRFLQQTIAVVTAEINQRDFFRSILENDYQQRLAASLGKLVAANRHIADLETKMEAARDAVRNIAARARLSLVLISIPADHAAWLKSEIANEERIALAQIDAEHGRAEE
jgi:hypothetical protein